MDKFFMSLVLSVKYNTLIGMAESNVKWTYNYRIRMKWSATFKLDKIVMD